MKTGYIVAAFAAVISGVFGYSVLKQKADEAKKKADDAKDEAKKNSEGTNNQAPRDAGDKTAGQSGPVTGGTASQGGQVGPQDAASQIASTANAVAQTVKGVGNILGSAAEIAKRWFGGGPSNTDVGAAQAGQAGQDAANQAQGIFGNLGF